MLMGGGVAAGALFLVLVTVRLSTSREREQLAAKGTFSGLDFIVGQPYPYIQSPYADVYRPQGYMQPAQYPLYPYESGSSYQDIKPMYEWYGQANVRRGRGPSLQLKDRKRLRAQSLRLTSSTPGKALYAGLHESWETVGHSNNYMGMTEPIRENNPLGQHVVGASDRVVPYSDVESASQNDVVDPALRYMWRAFSGQRNPEYPSPMIGRSMDAQVRCDQEASSDPHLCDGAAFSFNPVSSLHTDTRALEAERKAEEQDKRVPTIGRKGDLIVPCNDPAGCGDDADWHRFAPKKTSAPSGPSEPDPAWLKDLRNVSGYSGP